ncbi:hypothetical protein DFJ74DRAFT_497947 [Hyaloraphidium curvatum]|nr:hypothetical protein DFJ74DRAFT_497947 [Hyaloraphidium curvatum]
MFDRANCDRVARLALAPKPQIKPGERPPQAARTRDTMQKSKPSPTLGGVAAAPVRRKPGTATASPPVTASPAARKIADHSSDTPRRPTSLFPNQLRGPERTPPAQRAGKEKENVAVKSMPTTSRSNVGSKAGVRNPSMPSPASSGVFLVPEKIQKTPPSTSVACSSSSDLDHAEQGTFGQLLATLSTTVEAIHKAHASDAGIQESMVRALDFERKKSAVLEDQVAGLTAKIATLEIDLRRESERAAKLSSDEDIAVQLKEERERRAEAEREAAELRLVVERLSQELQEHPGPAKSSQ